MSGRDLTYRRTSPTDLAVLATLTPTGDAPKARERWRRVAPSAFRALADDVPEDDEDDLVLHG